MADVEVHFIIVCGEKYKTNISRTYKSCQDAELEPKWCTTADCMKIKSSAKNAVYVFDAFQGSAFEHLKKLKCRMYGLQCVQECLDRAESLPKAKHPVFCLSMQKSVVCCTNMPADKRHELHTLVEYMNGEVSRDFTEAVTHLVATEVGSKKYEVAACRKLPIVLPDWVLSSWEACHAEQKLDALESTYVAKFFCPIFKGLVITVSGISDRKEVKDIVESHGGTYMGEMKMNECTHLIISEPKGQKYQFALQWKICIVRPEWLRECVQTGYYISEHSNSFEANQNSTPNKKESKVRLPSILDISAIGSISTTHVDNTMQGCDTTVPADDPLDEVKVIRTGFFLDGCKICIHGFSKSRLDKVRKLIDCSGAVRVSALTKSPTHVIVDSEKGGEEAVALLAQASCRPSIVIIRWLVECVKQEKLLDAVPYAVKCSLVAGLMSPIKELIHAETTSTTLAAESVRYVSMARSMVQARGEPEENEEAVLEQYAKLSNKDGELANASANVNGPACTERPSVPTTHEKANCSEAGNQTNAEHRSLSKLSPCFQGMLFCFNSFEEHHLPVLTAIVEDSGGAVINDGSSVTADFMVVPLLGCSVVAAAPIQLATVTWLQTCVELGSLLPVEGSPMFSPLSVEFGPAPLSGCVACVSGFTGAIREAICHIVVLLGGESQEDLVKKNAKNLRATTHLIVAEPAGKKYEAALNWGIPRLTLAWLLDSARLGCRQTESNYECVRADALSHQKTAQSSGAYAGMTSTTSDVPPGKCSTPGSIDCHMSPVVLKQFSETKNMSCDIDTLVSVSCSRKQVMPVIESDECAVTRAVLQHPENAAQMDAAKLINPRLLDIHKERTEGETMTPRTKSSKLGIDPQSKWLDADASFHPGFDLGDVADMCQSPAVGTAKNVGSRRSSLPMEELLEKHLRIAMQHQQQEVSGTDEPSCIVPPVTTSAAQEGCRPLEGVTACFSRKLSGSGEQEKLGAIVRALGGEWLPGAPTKACTHFISSGRRSDPECRQAAKDVEHIVSPHWLTACQAAAARVGENAYPSNFNPNMCLNVSQTQMMPPTRRSTRAHTEAVADGRDANESMDCKNDPASTDKTAASCDFLANQLQNFISTTKPAKVEKRRSKKRLLASTEGEHIASATSMNYGKSAAEPSPDPSQPVQVIWDDTVSRLEKEKLAEHLDRASCPVDDGHHSSIMLTSVQDNTAGRQQHSSDTENERPGDGNWHAFDHSSKRSRKDAVTRGERAAEQHGERTFLLSGLSASERDTYSVIVQSLGGRLIDSPSFDAACTHLVVGKPTKNEKFLASVATGKWVLHPSYFEACWQAQAFVEESAHEWGGPGKAVDCRQMGDVTARLAAAGHRWRKAVQAAAVGGCERRAFSDWKVVLCTEEAKESGFRRLLEAGGASLVATRPPFDVSSCSIVTHAFLDLRKLAYQVSPADFEPLLKLGVPCLKPEYIASFLTEEDTPSFTNFEVAELESLAIGVSDAHVKKRKATNTAPAAAKKAR